MADVVNDEKALSTLTIHVTGMHCANCELTIERGLGEIPGVMEVRASRQSGTAELRHRGALDVDDVRNAVAQLGYRVASFEQDGAAVSREQAQWSFLQIGIAFAVVIGIALLVQWLGLVPKGLTVSENTGYGLAFVIGLVASVTSCMAVTGGLLLAVAARYAEASRQLPAWRRFQPHLAFNAGRLVSYVLLGGAIGAIGSALTLSAEVTSALIITASAMMILLGLQMLRLLPAFGSLSFVPKRFAHRIHGMSERNRIGGAFLLGALTFFLPCGFTQALQLYVLAKGSFTVGALTMLAFAVGTLPALLSLSALTILSRGAFRTHLLRLAGAAVVVLGFLNIQYGLVLVGGGLWPLSQVQVSQPLAPVRDGKQVVAMKIDGFDYIPNRFNVKQGVPVEWRIDAKDAVGCGRILLSRSLGVQKFLSDAEINVIVFTPQQPGEYDFNCGMGMMTAGSGFTVH